MNIKYIGKQTSENMNSPSLRKATQVCFQGCCPTPMLRVPEPEHPIAKTTSTSSACRRDFMTTTTSSFFPNIHFTNHESIPSLQESFVQFIKAYPNYSDTAPVDQIRAREYCQLSNSDHVCLDYIGIGLFSQSQVKSHQSSAIPIPSSPPPSEQSGFPLFGVTFKSVSLKSQLLHGGEGSALESAIKKRIMDFLNISQNDYSMVFTANRSAAFKLVAESYPFQSSHKLLTVYDHESEALDSMVNMSEKRGALVMAAEFKWPRLRIHSAKLRKMIVRKKKTRKKHRGLFVFPLQSRMTGASYSYQWMTMAQEHGWHVLLDACALGPKDMDSFGLSLFHPDFLICSFYKVFGENPTGFGCLFVKNSTVPILEASAGGGIVSITPAKSLLHSPEDTSGTDAELEQIVRSGIEEEGANKLSSIASPYTDQDSKSTRAEENVTFDIHEKQSSPPEYSEQVELEKHIVPVQERHILKQNESSDIQCRCLDHVDSLGLRLVNSRGRYLINWLVSALKKLQHPNRLDNFPLVTIYGPNVKFDRGPALAFNIHDWKGEKVEPVLVQKLADRNNISLGVGHLHCIWFSEKCEEQKQIILEKNIKEKETARIKNRKADQGISVATIALTFLANFEDIYRLWAFIAQFLDADFVEKERWRYTALNQKTIEV